LAASKRVHNTTEVAEGWPLATPSLNGSASKVTVRAVAQAGQEATTAEVAASCNQARLGNPVKRSVMVGVGVRSTHYLKKYLENAWGLSSPMTEAAARLPK
jgi:hypothetical protein